MCTLAVFLTGFLHVMRMDILELLDTGQRVSRVSITFVHISCRCDVANTVIIVNFHYWLYSEPLTDSLVCVVFSTKDYHLIKCTQMIGPLLL
jgi:hypothetical protein